MRSAGPAVPASLSGYRTVGIHRPRVAPFCIDRAFILCILLLRTVTGVAWAAEPDAVLSIAASSRLAAARGARHFEEHIRPLLTRHCLKCHGADEGAAGLDLTQPTKASQPLPSGEVAIVPGAPDASELWRRITSEDPESRMPPEGPPLSEDERREVRAWLEAGAAWPRHWAYASLSTDSPPRPSPSEASPNLAPSQASPVATRGTPIDDLVQQERQARGLDAAPPADRTALLRRVHIDLTGLAPTWSELQRFLADERPDAYERVVDQLLASPRYGERWARHWLDLVHFAETHGHDQDRPREHAWPYRDYVIRALNEDRAYPRFIQEQIAGDVLYPDSPWSIAATGFLAAGPWDESSLRDIQEDSSDREFARYLDRDDIVTTVMSTFLSSSVHCARCHHHKFDPISQDDYYGLQAVFAGTDKANRPWDLDEGVSQRREELRLALAALDASEAAQDPRLLSQENIRRVTEWLQRLRQRRDAWRPLQSASHASAGGWTLRSLEDGSVRVEGMGAETDTYTIEAPQPMEPITALRLELLPDELLPQRGPGRAINGNLHLSELRVWFRADDSLGEWTPVPVADAIADFNQVDWSIEKALDGQDGTAWGIHPQEGMPHEAVFFLRDPIQLSRAKPGRLRVELHQRHGQHHVIGRFRLSWTGVPQPSELGLDTHPEDIAAIVSLAPERRTESQLRQLVVYVLRRELTQAQAALPAPQLLYCGTRHFVADGSFRPAAQPRSVFVLNRGNLATPLHAASIRALSCVEGMPHALEVTGDSTDESRRAALARWISHADNGLMWRSMANRAWLHHFGRGLVDTPNDFGQLGSYPTHPELLEWLASTLRRTGGSLKDLHRRIVLSATYRQSSEQRPNAAERDADNRWLTRMNRRRLDAETYRDTILQVAERLDLRMGGPSVRHFRESPGVAVTPVVDYDAFDSDSPGAGRRSIYRFVFRTVPDPFLEALDCPDASQWTPQRGESITARQALATLNDKFVIHQSLRLAEVVGREADGADAQARGLFERILLRSPTEEEKAAVGSYLKAHGVANTARFLFNTNEFLFIE